MSTRGEWRRTKRGLESSLSVSDGGLEGSETEDWSGFGSSSGTKKNKKVVKTMKMRPQRMEKLWSVMRGSLLAPALRKWERKEGLFNAKNTELLSVNGVKEEIDTQSGFPVSDQLHCRYSPISCSFRRGD